ncbi:hypothetical protein FACS189485_15750 [Spirochaetia bacterium]|nr:hypothetical protein FACS189485_15750 [Spirochaetia bacterium]
MMRTSVPLFCLVSVSLVSFFSCVEKEDWLINQSIINRRLEELSQGNYIIKNCNTTDRVYRAGRHSKPQFSDNTYTEVPLLPYGFYLEYLDYNPFPFLSTILPVSAGWELVIPDAQLPILSIPHVSADNPILTPSNYTFQAPRLMIQEIYLYADAFVVKIAQEQRYIKILFTDINAIVDIDMPDKNFELKYSFRELTEEFLCVHNTITEIQAVFDVAFKKKANINNYPVEGMKSAGVIYSDASPYLVGETIFSFFSFSIDTGETTYYRDRDDFNSFLAKSDSPETIELLDFVYKERTRKELAESTKVDFYTVEMPNE